MRVKLVRDNTPCHTGKQTLVNSREGKHALLCAKLHEESDEIARDATNPEEYADLLEVALALAALNGVTRAQILKARNAKLKERGNFSRGVVWHGP